VLAVAAIVGHRFNFGLLQAVVGLAKPDLLAALRELLTAQMMVEQSSEWYAFRHALTRQAVYAELLGRERQTLHKVVGEALESRASATGDAPHDDLARHFYAAGVWDRAAHYARRAGEQALALHAPGAAIELLTLAIRAAEQCEQPVAPALRRARGLAHETLRDFEAGRTDFEAALELARTTDDRRAEWEVLLDLGLLWASRDYGRTGEYYARALPLVTCTGHLSPVTQAPSAGIETTLAGHSIARWVGLESASVLAVEAPGLLVPFDVVVLGRSVVLTNRGIRAADDRHDDGVVG
jgi:hypothetical protein